MPYDLSSYTNWGILLCVFFGGFWALRIFKRGLAAVPMTAAFWVLALVFLGLRERSSPVLVWTGVVLLFVLLVVDAVVRARKQAEEKE
jgi:hypothetical protein